MSNRPLLGSPGHGRTPWPWRACSVGLAVLCLALLYGQFAPLAIRRDVVVATLYAGRALYEGLVIAAALAVIAGIAWGYRLRARERSWRPAARVVLPGAAVLLMVMPIELLAARVSNWSHRLPELPTRFESDRSQAGEHMPVRRIVVVGESSARGEPYDFSLAQIAAWQLEQVFPGTRFDVTMLARGGLSLEDAILYLTDLSQRPDAIILYSGHNEFQARYRWSRNVAYYADDDPAIASAWLPGLSRISPLHRLLDQSLERHRVERPPPPRSTRELVDRPVCTAAEYEFLHDDYRLRLEHALAWSRRVGALPIVIVPAGNDVDFPPSRSYLDPVTPPAERQQFVRDFESARALERDDPIRARSAYAALLAQQPLFAEAHYRYAMLLRAAGAPTEGHFQRARDLDGMPMRMPSDFQVAARQAARDHGAILVDAQQILDADRRADLFHDGQHPTLAGYVALTRDLLTQLRARHAFGWPDSTPVPEINLVDCAIHFGLDTKAWASICRRSAGFYGRIAYIRYDPTPHLARAALYEEATAQLDAYQSLADRDAIRLGIDPAALRAAATLVRPTTAALLGGGTQ